MYLYLVTLSLPMVWLVTVPSGAVVNLISGAKLLLVLLKVALFRKVPLKLFGSLMKVVVLTKVVVLF